MSMHVLLSFLVFRTFGQISFTREPHFNLHAPCYVVPVLTLASSSDHVGTTHTSCVENQFVGAMSTYYNNEHY